MKTERKWLLLVKIYELLSENFLHARNHQKLLQRFVSKNESEPIRCCERADVNLWRNFHRNSMTEILSLAFNFKRSHRIELHWSSATIKMKNSWTEYFSGIQIEIWTRRSNIPCCLSREKPTNPLRAKRVFPQKKQAAINYDTEMFEGNVFHLTCTRRKKPARVEMRCVLWIQVLQMEFLRLMSRWKMTTVHRKKSLKV